MTLKERIAHLEKWYEKQETIEALKTSVRSLEKELEAVEDFLEIKVERHKMIVVEKKKTGK